MKRFQLVNNLTGWLAFLVAAFTYCSTVEPTASFWDCPEFITTAFKLEVGHPPGAPFFMLTGNLFSQFTDDPAKVAYCVNIMSALLSAMCILFLFWSITHLARKLICTDGIVATWTQTILIMACGLTGALAYTWSDTFWFSAVEGEVYAYSSMFTALVFWLILKWEDHADEPHSDRWLVLIFYLTGLSIGVHLLNLLCLPAIALVYYYKKSPQAGLRGSLIALGVSMVLVAAVLYGVVPGIVKVGGWFELFFVNTLGLPFNTGMVVYLLVLIGVVLAAIWSTTKKDRKRSVVLYTLSVALLGIPFYGHGGSAIVIGIVVLGALVFVLNMKDKEGNYLLRKRFLNTSLLCMLMLMIGYSSYAVIVIRSTQNTPMDQNSPEDIFTLGTYLGREQYGSRPLFMGEAYNSQEQALAADAIGYEKGDRIQRKEKASADEKDSYETVSETTGLTYPSALTMLFPRIYSANHAQAYDDWLGGVPMKQVTFRTADGYDYPGEIPTQGANLRFFLSYQVNFMYWRYFMWNFAGRQNDIQGNGELEHGNWITGIPFIDNAMYGDQSLLPDVLKENKGHNVFYCLPLLLGLLGLFWQAYKGERGIRQFWVVFFLFFMTGLAIVLYLNQTPQQPRERDYAYAGSFYAFAIWIGLGVAAIADWLGRLLKKQPVAVAVASVIGILVPLQMVSQTWDDHDRSDRYACRDFGLNYLNTLPDDGKPIIFTNGDNDTFPLWYAQDTEGIRTDARVCNLSYLQTDWYTDQMCRPAWKSPALPITWNRYEYVDNIKGFGPDGSQSHDVFYIHDAKEYLKVLKQQMQDDPSLTAKYGCDDPFDIRFIIDNFVRNPEICYVPTDSIVVHVDPKAVIASGMMLPNGPDSIPESFSISLKGKSMVTKSEMMVYEMLASHNWVRPLYMSVTLGAENYAGLDRHLVLEGLASRVTPFTFDDEVVDTEKMYDNLMHKFRYGGLEHDGIYLDQTIMRMCHTHRSMFVQLIGALLKEGKTDKALKALEYCKKVIPEKNVPYEILSVGYDYDRGIFKLPDYWHQVGRDKEAERILVKMAQTSVEYLEWYNSLGKERLLTYGNAAERQYLYLSAAIEGLDMCHSKQHDLFMKKADQLQHTAVGKLIQYRAQQRYMQQMQGAEYADEEEYAEE